MNRAATALLPLVTILLLASRPDEGQWLPQQLREMDWEGLRKRGMQLSKDELWHPEKGGVLSATVQLGGCSASFVSAEGLIVTNHHCGFGAVQRLSTPQKNYVRDGYAAASRDAELPAPGVEVYVVRRIEDVTAQVTQARAEAKTDLERWHLTEAAIAKLIAAGEKQPNTKCSVSTLFEGREYHLYYRTRIQDVRLVYAPPRSIGEYGGEVDNWEWPRHTGDFAFFRAYVAPDGTTRRYHAENVPFRPEHFLKVSANGVQPGDLVLIMGYPGRTERYLTSTAVQDRQGVYYPLRHEVLTRILGALEQASKGDEARALELSSLIKSLANVQKNALGMVKGLARNAVVERKLREEEQFATWVRQTPERGERWGKLLATLQAIDAEEQKHTQRDLVLSLIGSSRLQPLLAHLMEAVRAADAAAAADGDGDGDGDGAQSSDRRAAMLRRLLGSPALTKDLHEVQVPLLTILLEEARRLPGEQRLDGLEILGEQDDVGERLASMLSDTKMLDPKARVELLRAGAEGIAQSQDPLVVLARALATAIDDMRQREAQLRGRRLAYGPQWVEAQQQWRGKTFYPDANATLRVSIASVKGYEPRDAVVYEPFTTVAGILQKESGVDPFASPSALLAAAPGRKESRFFDQRIGDVPVCFLSDADTTGGNSGSPAINGKGELVGLNFDRVFENVAGDYGWNPDRSRNICVDIRYVLWILESVLPAPALLRERGI